MWPRIKMVINYRGWFGRHKWISEEQLWSRKLARIKKRKLYSWPFVTSCAGVLWKGPIISWNDDSGVVRTSTLDADVSKFLIVFQVPNLYHANRRLHSLQTSLNFPGQSQLSYTKFTSYLFLFIYYDIRFTSNHNYSIDHT